jgi:hypothetical protein
MVDELNILTIDTDIRNNLSITNSDKIKTTTDRINLVISNPNNISSNHLDQMKKELNRLQKSEIDNRNHLDFYISETIGITEKYKDLLNIPKKINFLGKTIDNDDCEKNKLILEYMKIIPKYSNVHNLKVQLTIKCSCCSHNLEFDIIDDNTHICNNCASEQTMFSQFSSYTDTNRINISTKYSYDRITHFRECIAQYHGKQNVTIPQKIYSELDEQFEFHGLLIGDENTPRSERYSSVTKKTIMTFLKELGYPKHYENINLIYSVITDIKLDDIDYINEQILLDFDILSELYDKRFNDTNKKNFINTQYVLFQLLCRHGHPCDKEDFSNIKTVDRKFFHENIIKQLFEELKWNYTSIF